MRLSHESLWFFISIYFAIIGVLNSFLYTSGIVLQANNNPLSHHITSSTADCLHSGFLPSSSRRICAFCGVAAPLQQLRFKNTNSLKFTFTWRLAPTSSPLFPNQSASLTRAARSLQLFSGRRNRSGSLASLTCNRKACLALRMEDKQRSLLNPALVKLDQFCRTLLSNEQGVQEAVEGSILQGDNWTHTIFPIAFQALQNSLRTHTSADAADSDKARLSVLLERFNDCSEKGGGGDCSAFEFFCNLISTVLGLPYCPERKHELPRREEGGTGRRDSTLGGALLKLPDSEEIEFIAKQIGRLPYGLLSVLCRRKTWTQEKPVESGGGEEQQEETNASLEQQIPQVLVVSPFWIADNSKREPNSSAGCLSNSVRQRVVESVVKLTSLDINQSETQDEVIGSLTPFPTTFWLSDSKLTAKLSQAELTGWIKEVENGLLAKDTDIQERIICDNIRFIALRWLLIPKLFLSHFYSANKRCDRCKTRRPEGFTFPEYESDDSSACASCETQGAAEASSKKKCVDCFECGCKLCKLLQCHRLRGIGGLQNFCRVRCLHMQYAHHLACPTTLGNLIDDAFHMHSFTA